MTKTNIEWVDENWNITRGCKYASPGCRNCYAARYALRFSGVGQTHEGMARMSKNGLPVFTGKSELCPHKLEEPFRRKSPTSFFVCSTSDLLLESIPDDYIAAVVAAAAARPQHRFMVLTKRADRMQSWSEWLVDWLGQNGFEGRFTLPALLEHLATKWQRPRLHHEANNSAGRMIELPLRNLWFGVSVENQEQMWRVDHAIQSRSVTGRVFVSAEPLLGPLDFGDRLGPGGVDMVITGGESGPGARQCDVAWIRDIVHQCQASGAAPFVKQLGAFVVDRNDAGFNGNELELADEGDSWDLNPERVEEHINGYREEYQGAPVRIRLRSPKGGDMNEWPNDLRVREEPNAPRSAAHQLFDAGDDDAGGVRLFK